MIFLVITFDIKNFIFSFIQNLTELMTNIIITPIRKIIIKEFLGFQLLFTFEYFYFLLMNSFKNSTCFFFVLRKTLDNQLYFEYL